VAGTSPASGKRYYLDTSAYLCILLGEEGNQELRKEIAGAGLVSSVALVLETNRNLVRLCRESTLSPDEFHQCHARLESDIEQFLLRDITLDLCLAPVMPAISTPRSLDLIHLRTALWFHEREPITRFITLDEGQRQAARELGLNVDR
jgi:hypothetical protein